METPIFSSWIISGLCLLYDVTGYNCVTRFIKQDTFNFQDFENKQAVKTSRRKHWHSAAAKCTSAAQVEFQKQCWEEPAYLNEIHWKVYVVKHNYVN
jgi:hypothetical protein